MKTNTWLWIVQGLLAALFLFAGGMKLVMPVEAMQQGPVALPGPFLRFLGRPDPPVGAWHPSGVDPACRVGPDRDHGRRDRDHGVDRPDRAGADSDDRRSPVDRGRLPAHTVYCVTVADRREARRAALSPGTRRAVACASRALC